MAEVLINALDTGNPLFLQNNDNSNAPIVNVKLTGSDNYKKWSTDMRIALKGKNKMVFVDGTCVRPVTSPILSQQWERCNAIVLGWILRSNLLAREPILDVKEAFNIVSREESHRGLHPSSGSSSVMKSLDILLVFKRNPNLVKQRGNYNSRSFNGNVEAQKGTSTSTGSTTFDNAFTKEQMMKILSLINEKPTGNANVSMEGANQHLTVSTKNMFNVIDISSLNLTVSQPNGTLAKIIVVGNLRLSANIVLYDVLVVPEYGVSLLSVHKLIKDSKLFVGFDEHTCYIQDLNLIKIVGIGNEFGGLYMFDEDKNGKSKCGMSDYVFVCHVSKDLWHCRLGYPSDQVLSILSKNIGLNYDKHVSPCDICHKAKQIMDSFSLSDHKSVTVGDLVHLDLWGPYKVVSREGLLSYVLSGASPYLLVYGKEPPFSHIKCFGCLCYSTVLNDKFSSSPNDDERDLSVGDCNVMASPDIGSSPPVNREATFATQLDDTNNISEGSSVKMSGSRSCIKSQSRTNNGDEPHTVRKSSIVSNLPSKYNDFILPSNKKYGIEKHANYSKLSTMNFCFATNLNKFVEPKSYVEAAQDKHWVETMNNEMEALFRNNTWILTDLLVNRKTIGCKLLFKIKYKSSGEIERYKARLLSKGFSHREGIDYEETFSLVVKMVTVRYIISLVMHNNWPLFQLDVNNAFLYRDLHEDVYMDLPPGYYDKFETKVCKLVKSLYGLKQAPRQWNEKLTCALKENGFEQSINDYSLFVKNHKGVFMVLLVYVDDNVITGNNTKEIEKFKLFLKSKFQIKDLGTLKYFLGIEILENKNDLCLSKKYCLELLCDYGLLACKPPATPMHQNVSLSHEESEKDKKLKSLTRYQKLVGKLIYMSITRPYTSYALHCLSQHMHSPLQSHFTVGLRVLRYLKMSPGAGIQFYHGNSLGLHIFQMQTGLSVWLQESLSLAEAEYRCMASTTCEVIWLTHLLKDLDVEGLLLVSLYCDSTSAIQIAANPVFHDKTKHFEIDVHLLKDKVASSVMSIVKVHLAKQVIDSFTKSLSIAQHKMFCEKLNMVDMFEV
ncbi:ribonuclease H-like domain-containing protein [Tanacetum coccineum]